MLPEIELFGQTFVSYHVMSIISITLGLVWFAILLKRMAYSLWSTIGLMVMILCSFLVGARVLNYVVNRPTYVSNDISIWTLRYMGFSVYGGIGLVLFGLVVYYKLWKRPFWPLMDRLTIPFSISFVLMRLGCFLNGCCYGRFTTGPFGITLPRQRQGFLEAILGRGFAANMTVHPTQLYELFGVLVAVPLWIIMQKRAKTPDGVTALVFSIYFTGVRFLVLPLRQLPYPEGIIHYGYPLLYVSIIAMGYAGLILLLRRS